MKKVISVFLSLLLIFQVVAVSITANAGSGEKIDYIITNPYAKVDWENYKAYKTQLHCHTTASDGFLKIKDAVRMYYDLDYDIVAFTDHGTINKGWNKNPNIVPILRALRKERTGGVDVVPLSDAEYYSYINGTAKTTNGLVRTNNDGMLDVEKGIELNMATPFADCHLTGYWSDYGQGLAGVFGDYETPVKGVKDAGGVTMLSHVGEYVYTKKDSAKHIGQLVDDYYPTKFARIFLDNPGSCVGMGINSATDAHTRCDRILYDQILAKTIPNGVTPWGFSFSDSHNDASVNDAYTMMLMPEKSQTALRECMVNGEFFSVSHYSFATELNGMREMPNCVPDVDVDAMHMNDTPMVTKLTVDEKADKIYVECKNASEITWVSDGDVILRTKVTDNKAEIDLHSDKLLNNVNLYVRFYITGEQGICYSQPMVVREKGTDFAPVYVPKTRDISTFLRKLVTFLDWTCFKFNPVVWAFKYFALGYDPIAQMNDSVKTVLENAVSS